MSRYDVFRRRIAPVAFACAIGGIAWQSCHKHERTKATFVLDFGSASHAVHAVEADLWTPTGDVPFASFHRVALPGLEIGPTQFVAQMPSADVVLKIDVDLGSASRAVVRHIHAEDGAVISVPLASELQR